MTYLKSHTIGGGWARFGPCAVFCQPLVRATIYSGGSPIFPFFGFWAPLPTQDSVQPQGSGSASEALEAIVW